MPLELTKNFRNGNAGKYWEITATNINYLERTAEIVVSMWKNKTTRDAPAPNNESMFAIAIRYDDSDFPFDDADLIAAGKTPLKIAYDDIKTREDVDGLDFTGAIDV